MGRLRNWWFFSQWHRLLGRKNPSTSNTSPTYDFLVTSPNALHLGCRKLVGVKVACEYSRFSLLLAVFTRRNVCATATEMPYWWRKICPESGQELWLVDIVVILFYLLSRIPDKRKKGHKGRMQAASWTWWICLKTVNSPGIESSLEKASEFCGSSFAVEQKTLP